MRFNQICKETEAALSKPDVNFRKLLACSDLCTAYRQNNSNLLYYLLDLDHQKEIFDILIETDQRKDHKDIFALFQTSNMTLHRSFADSIELVEYLFEKTLREINEKSLYAAGTISRVISRAWDNWANEIHDIFRLSKKLYPLIIDRIDVLCIYYQLNDLVMSDQYPISELIWNLFKVVSGDYVKNNNIHNPRVCFLSTQTFDNMPSFDLSKFDNLDSEEAMTIKKKLIASIELMTAYFKNRGSDVTDFKKIVLNYIASIINDKKQWLVQFFDLATEIGYNETVYNAAYNQIKSLVLSNSDYKGKILPQNTYFATYVKEAIQNHASQEYFQEYIISLFNENVDQFSLLTLSTVIQKVIEAEPEWLTSFVSTIEHFIAYKWNQYHLSNQILTPMLLDFSKLLPDECFKDHEQFKTNLKLWKNESPIENTDEKPCPDTFSYQFEFPQDFYNSEELDKYVWKQA